MTDERRDEDGPRGGQQSRFLDLEISKVLHDASSRAARAAFEQLLVERVKERLAERMGARLDALADLAVDDLVADLETNLDIERRIEQRGRLHERHLERLRDLLSSEKGE